MILFGYKGGSMSTLLYEDGVLIYGTAEKMVSLSLPDDFLERIRLILKENRQMIHSYGIRINGDADIGEENCFIFEDFHVIDWDLTRWYMEEDRKKHPEYYNNSVKVELTETYIRAVFDEICAVIEQAEKEIRYSQIRVVL